MVFIDNIKWPSVKMKLICHHGQIFEDSAGSCYSNQDSAGSCYSNLDQQKCLLSNFSKAENPVTMNNLRVPI